MNTPPQIWHIKGGDSDGPSVVVLGGTHGDELTGIAVIDRLAQRFGVHGKPFGVYNHKDISGSLYFGYGNPEAIAKHTRAASSGRDLNRSFSENELRAAPLASDSPDLRRARELAPLLQHADYLFDIHATSNPAPAFACFGNITDRHRELCSYLPINAILTDPRGIINHEYGLSELATTDYIVDSHGGTGICYETGLESDLSVVDRVYTDVLRLLGRVGILASSKTAEVNFPRTNQKIYELIHCAHARYDGFTYAPGMDQGWQTVIKGALLGTYANGEPERIHDDGILLFPLAAHKVITGKALYFLAR